LGGRGRGALGRTADVGRKIAENATQAVARDIMAEAMLRAWRRLQQVPVMTVHDELVYPLDAAAKSWTYMENVMLEPPSWAGGLPLAGEAKIMRRYGVSLSSGTVAKSVQQAEDMSAVAQKAAPAA